MGFDLSLAKLGVLVPYSIMDPQSNGPTGQSVESGKNCAGIFIKLSLPDPFQAINTRPLCDARAGESLELSAEMCLP
jgi:hypothetical protein